MCFIEKCILPKVLKFHYLAVSDITVIKLGIATDSPEQNNLDADQTLQYVMSGQGLHCLPLVQQYFKHIS